MSNQNATASWSGYAHQGQVGLLVALKEMQRVDPTEYETHFVCFETHEDFAIYKKTGDETKIFYSAHQVKAYYSARSNKKDTYKKVLNACFAYGQKRYLHTAVEINDWHNCLIPNDNNVNRYEYDTNKFHCDTTKVESYIKKELENILGADSPYIIPAYQRLSFCLDHRIRDEHKKKFKRLFDIKFSFKDINEIIRNTDEFDKKAIYDCRKLLAKNFVELVKSDNITDQRVKFLETNVYVKISELSDHELKSFLQRMNFDIATDDLEYSQHYYNRNGLKQVFFKVLIEAINAAPKLEDLSIKYEKENHPNKFILSTIINEEEEKLDVVDNILANLTNLNILWQNHSIINKEIKTELVKSNPNISRVENSDEYDDDRNKFRLYSKTNLIPRTDALQILNNEGDN